MARIFLTAFEPYDRWPQNSSWLTLVELTRSKLDQAELTTRLYPVDFGAVRQRLEQDLKGNYDYAIHLGQAPGTPSIRLEAVGLNLAQPAPDGSSDVGFLVPDGPTAYRSPLPLGQWRDQLRRAGIPADISYHAGTYLCNATLYWSCHLTEHLKLHTQSVFIHLPLDPAQVAEGADSLPSMPASYGAEALRLIIQDLITQRPLPDLEFA